MDLENIKWKCLCEHLSCLTLQTCGLGSSRLLCPWNSPGKNTGMCCHFLLQGIFPTQRLNPGLLHCRQILFTVWVTNWPSNLWVWLYLIMPHKCVSFSRRSLTQKLKMTLISLWDMVSGLLISCLCAGKQVWTIGVPIRSSTNKLSSFSGPAPTMWRANCTALFYMRDLSMYRL